MQLAHMYMFSAEHFRLRHPTSLGFLTYTCSQCSSMSTERSLMEEHLRIYHKITENPTAKLIERFHTPTTSDALGFNCVSPSTMSGSTLPLSLTNSNATIAQNSLALNLVNAIAALQHVNKTHSQQATVSTASSSCTTCTVSTVSSTKNTIITPTAENIENSEPDTNLDMQIFQDGSVTVEAQTSTSGSPAFAISGSRRRKATTPGRICLSASKSTNSCSSSEEGDVSACKINQSVTNSIKNETANTNSSLGAKHGFLSGVDEVDGQIKDDSVGSPKSKRICKDVDNTVIDTNISKCVSFSNITPFCLPIGNSLADNKQVPLVTFSSPNVNGLNSLSIPSPFFGQLIPLSSLPENVICGLSTTIMNNPQTSTVSNSGDNSITTSTGHHNELQTAQNHPSAWVLANPSGNLSCNLTQQAELTALQPTLFVPVPTLGDSSVTPALKVPQSLDTSTTNPLANCAGILRYPDIIEALKCMAANGNLISAINVPSSSYSTNIQTQANNSSNYNDNIERLQSASQISSPNLSSSNNLAALVAHLTASSNSRTIPQSVATNIPNATCGITSTDNNTADSLPFSTKSTSESSNISNFNTLVSPTPVYTKVDQIDSDGTSLVPGLTSVNNIGTNEDINFPSNDQALDMSVRSVSMPSEHSQSFTQKSNITKSDTKNLNLLTGININDSTCKEPLEQPTFNVVNNVAEVINAAIKGGLKQRLIQSIEVPVSSLFPNPAQCLTALANTISSLPTMNETVVSSDNPSDKRNQNINCQNESYTNTNNIKRELMNFTMTNSHQNVEPTTLTTGDNKLIDSTNKSAQNNNSTNTLINLPPTSSHIVSLAQLQAIMAALANASSVSISLPVNSTASTSLSLAPTCSATVSSLNSSNPSIQQLINPSTPSIPSSETNVLINTSGSSLNMTGSVTTSEAGNTSLIPGLNNLTSVCGFTLTGPSGFVNNNITTYNPSMSANFGTINSNIKGITVPSGECISLTGILSGNVANLNINNNSNSAQIGHTVVGNPALINFISANKSPVQSSVTLNSTNATRLLTNLATSTAGTNLLSLPNNGTIGNNSNICGSTLLGATNIPSGAISLLDPHQALFAAAAAAAAQNIQKPGGVHNAINQIALANLKLPNTNGRNIGATAPVIGLLDPRTGLQLRVADTSTTTSAILTSSNLTDCLNNNYSHSSDNEQIETQINESSRMTTNETDLNQTNELETSSNYEDQIDEEWEPEQDETCSIQSNAQQLCLKRNKICDKTSGDSESPSKNDQPNDLILTSDIQSNLLLGSSNKRSSSSARISGGNSSNNRRSLSSFNDSSNQQQLRPHRQNFTPTQNRILTEWYQLHQAKPYPSTDDTKELANISGLSYSQVKKWFANKRARSTSSGLPKPTPPLAPDSSTDPSATAALVAAAVAAATSAVADVNNMMTSTSTSPLNVSSSSSSNCSTIISNINSNDTSLSIQPFLLKSKSVSFSTQSYTDLNFLKTENDKQTEFVSNLISSHLQMNEENIQPGLSLQPSNNNITDNNDNSVQITKKDNQDLIQITVDNPSNHYSSTSDDIRVNDNDSMIDITTTSCDPIYYSVSSPPTLHVPINNRLSSPTNHLNTLSSVSSSSSSSLSSSSSSDEEYHKHDKIDNNKTTLKEKKFKVKTKLPTYDNDSILIISEETDNNNDNNNNNTSLNCSPLETITNINMNCTNVSTTDVSTSNNSVYSSNNVKSESLTLEIS
ncbi:unnamed protein product [Schistosoma spindalis]|nr:unnamed protein product [Schistosoma spindale]